MSKPGTKLQSWSTEHNTERHSHFDHAEGATAVWIFQGDFYVSSRPDLYLTTVLGSCIAVCMRDPVTMCGGMNHFLLPDAEIPDDHFPSLALRYGSYSIERLINAILSRGGKRQRLETKVFGGADLMKGMSAVGARNVEFVEHYFARELLTIAAADLRGVKPRKLRYFPTTGRVLVSELQDLQAIDTVRSESECRSKITNSKLPGAIEVFVP